MVLAGRPATLAMSGIRMMPWRSKILKSSYTRLDYKRFSTSLVLKWDAEMRALQERLSTAWFANVEQATGHSVRIYNPPRPQSPKVVVWVSVLLVDFDRYPRCRLLNQM